jgi:prepilin-type N-terminal cleavage/methylation domain-containing protein/prepilin-type processing-associated H-X9-DG protein
MKKRDFNCSISGQRGAGILAAGDRQHPQAGCVRWAGGFTLVELLVVIAILAILSALLLPTLVHAKLKAKVVYCTSNFHQWGVAVNLYAEDNKGALPSFNVPEYIGRNPWDVSSNMVPALPAYSIGVPMMFCPARPQDANEAQNWCLQNLHHSLTTMDDLNAWFLAVFGNFGLMIHSWWVPRYAGDPESGILFPTAPLGAEDSRGWPRRLEDPLISVQPILTDRCQYVDDGRGAGPDVSRAQDGHPFAGSVRSVNLMFGDGHVETRPKAHMKWRYTGSYYGAAQYSFY